ncbi:YhgE/Pip family protein [Deinococcus radiophilus]|uniref:YhgE/Pip family protein n=1 Tax=Deinococcus radiophilus TaxID=32062 RepID=UPI0036181848
MRAGVGTIQDQLPQQTELDRLSDGAATLAGSSTQLSSGLEDLSGGAGALTQGSAEVNSGAQRLADGLSQLHTQIPARQEEMGGDPAGLSRSVAVQTEKFAPVANNGAGFAPYFMALSLWVGAVLTTFIFPYQQLPYSARQTSQLARVARKALVPALVVIAQAALMVLVVQALGVSYLHPAEVLATSVLTSLTFLALILALILLFGAVGRFIALVLLIIQLASSGGSYPVELAPPLFQTIHNWVPVTQTVGALRHAIAGAYQGHYTDFMGALGAMLLVSAVLSLVARRRWELVDDPAFRPLIVSPLLSGQPHEDRPD